MRCCSLRQSRVGLLLVALVAAAAVIPAGFARAAGPQVTMAAEEFQVLELINAYRAGQGLQALKPQAQLMQAALTHNNNMLRTGIFEHSTATGDTVSQRIQATGITWFSGAGETLSMAANAQEVVEGWKASSIHNTIMLMGDYTHIGISLALTADGQKRWTAVYASGLEGLQGEVLLPNGTRVTDCAAPAPDVNGGGNGDVNNVQPNRPAVARLEVQNKSQATATVYMFEGNQTRLLGDIPPGGSNYVDYYVGTYFQIVQGMSVRLVLLDQSRVVEITP